MFSLDHTILPPGCISLKDCGREIVMVADDDDDEIAKKIFMSNFLMAGRKWVCNERTSCLLACYDE